MEPTYMKENRYSYHIGFHRKPTTSNYQSESPESAFERQVHSLYLEGQVCLHREEHMRALQAFRELMGLILHTVHPTLPPDPHRWPDRWIFPVDIAFLDPLIDKSVKILKETPIEKYRFPPKIVGDASTLSAAVATKLAPATSAGLQMTSYHGTVAESIEVALEAVDNEVWSVAVASYGAALSATPAADTVLRASLQHDLAVLQEKAGKRDLAEQAGREAVKLFTAANLPEGEVQALDTLEGVLRRVGKAADADGVAKQALALRSTLNLNTIAPVHGARVTLAGTLAPATLAPIVLGTRAPGGASLAAAPFPAPALTGATVNRPGAALATAAPSSTLTASTLPVRTPLGLPAGAHASTSQAPQLLALKFVKPDVVSRRFLVQGSVASSAIVLDGNAAANARAFLQALATTADIGLLTSYLHDPVQMVAYLPHMYFFVLPMAMGDCLAAMGNPEQAIEQYQGVLVYPFLNTAHEVPKVWTRMAQAYLDIGDAAYRRAKDNAAAYAPAKAAYENIVLGNKTLNAVSPLYKDAKFASLKARVTTLLAQPSPAAFAENPALSIKVMEALSRLRQIAAGLNFFGFGPNYVPPFSFEYLQNTARYFGQQASQIEQRYIQFKSTAENEELRREQLDQQAEVARQTVVLEERGVAEGQAGLAVSQANLAYAEVQRQNAVASKNDFDGARWELLEYATLEAWANASSVDRDDQVKLTISGYSYYEAEGRRRNVVLKDLAYQRTRLSHELESSKLQRAIQAADAYKAVAQAQLGQASARIAVAQQRVEIAKLQQRFAEENREFLDMREFSAQLWYELAANARRLKQRYLDMAVEIAFLMERAYNAETERNLRVVRYDYANTATNNLMGADLLLADIDSFTHDLVTTVRTKKIPVKQVLSVADRFPMAFERLRQLGRCTVATELADFDRLHAGLYLAKLRNVEIVFVGLTGATQIAGTLRNVGVSKFRLASGGVVSRMYPADVMVLSKYELRQDALAFRFNPNELRLFENTGIETLWELALPRDANDFDMRDILDVQLVMYYDGFFSPQLEANVRAALPKTGSASRGFSLKMMFPDELYYLANQGEAKLNFDAGMFPATQVNFKRTQTTLKALGAAGKNLVLRLTSAGHGAEIVLRADANGEVNAATAGNPLAALAGKPVVDDWTLRITAADNPALVKAGVLDLSGLADVLAFFEYMFDYR